jgi:hypothetical protein
MEKKCLKFDSPKGRARDPAVRREVRPGPHLRGRGPPHGLAASLSSSVRWCSSGASPSSGYWFKASADPAGWRESSGNCSTQDHDIGERDAFGEKVPRQLPVDTSACWVTIHSESNPAVTANGPGPTWCLLFGHHVGRRVEAVHHVFPGSNRRRPVMVRKRAIWIVNPVTGQWGVLESRTP